MKIWVGDKLLLPYSAVICLVIYFFIYEINSLLNTYKDSGGIWHKDRFRPLVTAGTNLVMNLIMVQFWGIYGIVLSTFLSTAFVGMPWLFHNLFTTMFPKKDFKYYFKNIIIYSFIALVSCIITYLICMNFRNNWIILIIGVITGVIIPSILYFLLFRKNILFKESIKLVDNMTKGKIKILKRIYQ